MKHILLTVHINKSIKSRHSEIHMETIMQCNKSRARLLRHRQEKKSWDFGKNSENEGVIDSYSCTHCIHAYKHVKSQVCYNMLPILK